MNSKFMCTLAFSVGAAIGSVVSWKVLKSKYEQIAREEIASVKERYSKKKAVCEPETEQPEHVEDSEVEEYKDMVVEQGYTSYSNVEEPKKGAKVMDDEESCVVIAPEEYREIDEYEDVTLIYYADGVLVDDAEEIIDNADEIIGPNTLDSFGIYEDDAVHVRNDRLKCYYEILRDVRNYSDIKKTARPVKVEE